MEKNKNKAFTLIELMIVIALIWIIALGASSVDFTNLTNKQRLNGFFYEIKTNFETTTNNALIWKAIKLADNSIIVPKKWQIKLYNSWDWKKKTFYCNDTNCTNYVNYTENNIIPQMHYNLNIECKRINSTLTGMLSWIWELEIEWWKIDLINWCWSNYKELKITAKYKNLSKIFTINTISGVIEEQ